MRVTTSYGGVLHVRVGNKHIPWERRAEADYRHLAKPEPQRPDEVTVGDETIPYEVFLARLGGA